MSAADPLAGYDVEAFIAGYVECALWTDCMPADPVCTECGDSLAEHGPNGEWVHYGEPNAADEYDHPAHLDEDYSAEMGGRESLDVSDDTREQFAGEDCRAFIAANRADLDAYGAWNVSSTPYSANQGDVKRYAVESAGHDFYLTRAGHGAGYWDRGLGDLGERLSEAAHAYGEPAYLIDCDDGTAEVLS